LGRLPVTAMLTELAKHTSSVIWGGFAFFALWLFREPLAKRLNDVAGFKAVGVELSFVATQLAGAAAEANRNNMVSTASAYSGAPSVAGQCSRASESCGSTTA
jgi:hypothetical protein